MTPRSTPPISKLLLLSLAAVTVATTGQAIAQDEEEEEPKKLQRIEVTGTQIDRVDIEGTSPVTSFSREEIERSGVTTLQELIRELPAAGPGSFNTQNDSQDDTSSGTAAISLRGLGASSTLTLVNGRRVVRAAQAQDITTGFVDLNSIPISAIERVDILKDGASPVYGTDAIAGVVNIILRDDYEGFQIEVGTGTSSEGDADEDTIEMVWGTSYEGGNAVVTLNHLKRDILIMNDRDFSRTANLTARGGPDFRSSSGNPGSYAPEGLSFRPDPACPAGRTVGSFCRFDYGPFLSMIPRAERTGLFVHVDQEFTDSLTGFTDIMVHQNSSFLSASPSPAFTILGGFTIPADHPNNPFADDPETAGRDLTRIRRRLTELGPRQDDTDATFFNATFGLEGQFPLGDNLWNWEATYQYGMNSVDETGVNGYVNARIMQQMLNNGTFNPFGCDAGPECSAAPLAESPEAIQDILDNARNPDLPPNVANALETQTFRISKSHLRVYNLKANGALFELPAGPAFASVGIQRRESDVKDIPDEQYLRGEIVGTESTFVLGNREVDAAFGELILPITKWAELQTAFRYEDYSDFGSTTNPKIGLLLKPTEDIRVRGTWSESFRAPSLAELGNISDESPFLIDPLRCPVTNDPQDCGEQETIVRFQPTTGLEPEESESINLGAVWQVTDEFSTSFDYWQIEVDNLIGTNNQFLLNQEAGNPDIVVRFPRTERDEELGIPGRIRFIRGRRINFGTEEVEGFDLNLNYQLQTAAMGRFSWNFLWTHFLTHDRVTTPGGEVTDLVGEWDQARGLGRPQDKILSGVDWSRGALGASLRANYRSEFSDVPGFDLNRDVDSHLTFDGQVRYSFLNHHRVSLSVQNIFDEEPPLVLGLNTAFSNQDNPVGRFWMLRYQYRM